MLRRLFFCLAFLVLCLQASAQGNAEEKINQTDAQGRPDGLWYTHTAAAKGEPEQATFGSYDHGKKTGLWYVSDGKGNISSIETFRFDVRDGEVKYFENGQLTCVGHYRGLNPKQAVDTMLLTDPVTGEDYWVSVPTERGSVRHGSWRFYDELTGRLIREEQYQIDELIYRKDFSVSPSDSAYYETRNKLLPHQGKKMPGPRFKQKTPARTLIGE
jgi:hypothetical protein